MKLKLVVLFLALFTAIVLGSFLYLRINNNSSASKIAIKDQEINSNLEELIVVPQKPNGEVVVKSATLRKEGFLVVRQMDKNKLSQIVEVSSPLNVGVHKNVQISLPGDELSKGELIIMIYEDYATDRIFNDLDMPALNENGNMTARFVANGKPLPASITEGESSGMAHSMTGLKSMAKVRYTDKGFVPEKVEVPVGSAVEFINESSKDMWVASIPHPQHTKLPTFDQFKLYKKGAIYRYVFDKKGTWEYHDHINPSLGGIVSII